VTAVLLSIALLGGVADTPVGTIPPPEPPGPERSYKPRHQECNTRACDRRVDRKIVRRRVQKRHKAQVRWNAHRRKIVAPFDAKLTRIARCESGLRWHIATGNGFYGGLQFTLGTWASVGGRGMPHLNTPLEQKYRAVKVHLRRGSWADWPVCGFR
jgi:hypothetical protein